MSAVHTPAVHSGSLPNLSIVTSAPSPEGRVVSMISPEAQLWEEFRAGDEVAFVKVYEDYVDVLFNYGLRFTCDREMILDCIQDFFLYLREHRDGLGATTSIKFYLFRSFRRRLSIYMDKANKLRKVSHERLDCELNFADCGIQQFIDEGAQKLMLERLKRGLEGLVPREREAVFFYYFEGLGYKEIARVMGFKHVSSARRLVYIALGNLRLSVS